MAYINNDTNSPKNKSESSGNKAVSQKHSESTKDWVLRSFGNQSHDPAKPIQKSSNQYHEQLKMVGKQVN